MAEWAIAYGRASLNAGAIQICADKSALRKKMIIPIGTPTQKRNCPKRIGTVVDSLRPKRYPTRTRNTNLR